MIGNGVIYSTSVVENAKTRVGDLAMIQAGTAFSKDIPPYIIAGGKPVKYAGPNTIIMEAAELTEKVRKHIANAYRLVFHGQTSLFDAINRIKDQVLGWTGDSEHHPVPGEFKRRVSSLRCKDCVDVGIFSSLILYL